MATIYGTNQADYFLNGTPGVDTINGWDVNNTPGDEGPANDHDWLSGGPGDTVNGGNGNDHLTGFGAGVTINGGADSDYLSVDGAGTGDMLDGGAGTDTLNIARLNALTLGSNISIADSSIAQLLPDGTQIVGIEQIYYYGDSGVDILTGGEFGDILDGYFGNDILEGGKGGDRLFGGAGVDTIVYSHSTSGVTVSLQGVFGSAQGGEAAGDVIMDVENILGSDHADKLTGNQFANYLRGNGGDDVLTSSGGDDTLDGGSGSDTAVFSGAFAGYRAYYTAATGEFLIANVADGTDTAKDIEVFQFADGSKSSSELESMSATVRTATISAEAPVVVEGSGGTTEVSFVVLLDAAVTYEESISYTISGTGVNAANSNDFSGAMSGLVTFLPGQDKAVITVTIATDFLIEQSETFQVTLGNPTQGLSILSATAHMTIANDDLFNVITGTEQEDQINGTPDDDHIYGLGSFDILNGYEGNDILDGGGELDYLTGGRGNDVINGGVNLPSEGTTNVIAYADEVNLQGGTRGVIVNLSDTAMGGQAAGTATDSFGDTDTIVNVNTIVGTGFADTVYAAYFSGSAIDESGTRFFGLAGRDTFVGGAGLDLVRYDLDESFGGISGKGIVANLTSGRVSAMGSIVKAHTVLDGYGDVDTVSSVEAVRGTGNADYVFGGTADEVFVGLAGKDSVSGGAGMDTVSYRIDAQYGGGAGVIVNLGASAVRVAGIRVAGGSAIDGFGDVDKLKKIEIIFATEQSDTLFASGAGSEFHAEGGHDTLVGGKGKDVLDGGAGDDTLTGGKGNDCFVFAALTSGETNGTDIITDFSSGKWSDDQVQIDHNLGFDFVDDVLAALAVVGADMVLNFGDGSSIIFAGAAARLFDAYDFVIV